MPINMFGGYVKSVIMNGKLIFIVEIEKMGNHVDALLVVSQKVRKDVKKY